MVVNILFSHFAPFSQYNRSPSPSNQRGRRPKQRYDCKSMTISLWLEELAVTDEEYRYYWSLLDKNEQDKAVRFVQTTHGRLYVASHGKLRLILAEYLDTPPEKINYAEQAFGKPVIVVNGVEHNIKFNLAHSDDKMLVAVGLDGQIGVDVEVWNDRIDAVSVANIYFAEAECRFWNGLPESGKDEFFYRHFVESS